MTDEWGSYACARVIRITVWVVSKNESNCLLENKMVSTWIWRNVVLLYVVQSIILWLTFKLSYHYRCNIVCTVSFLLYIATKNSNKIITVNSSTNAPITKKITLARFACLCFPLFSVVQPTQIFAFSKKKLCWRQWRQWHFVSNSFYFNLKHTQFFCLTDF